MNKSRKWIYISRISEYGTEDKDKKGNAGNQRISLHIVTRSEQNINLIGTMHTSQIR